MGTAYNPAQWSSFLAAQTSAAAALTGLLFVSLSINLGQIVQTPHLASRAGKTVVTLAAVLLVCTLCLVPGQTATRAGWATLCIGVVAWICITRLQFSADHRNKYVTLRQRMLHHVLAQASGLPFMTCGVSLLLRRGGGFHWLVAGVVASFVAALVDAWVLLVEIQR
jgi:hypothetical protein